MIIPILLFSLTYGSVHADAVSDSHAQARSLARNLLFRHLTEQTVLGAELASETLHIQGELAAMEGKRWDELKAKWNSLTADPGALVTSSGQVLAEAERTVSAQAEKISDDLVAGTYAALDLSARRAFVQERYFLSLDTLRDRCERGVVINVSSGGPQGLTDKDEPGGLRRTLNLPYGQTLFWSLYNPLATVGLHILGFGSFSAYKEMARQRADEIDAYFAHGAKPEDVARYYVDECAAIKPILERVSQAKDPARLAELKNTFEAEAAPYKHQVFAASKEYVIAVKALLDNKDDAPKRLAAEKTYREKMLSLGLVNMARVLIYQQVVDLERSASSVNWTPKSYESVRAYVGDLVLKAQSIRAIRLSKIEEYRSRAKLVELATEQRILALQLNHEFESILIDLVLAYVKSEDTAPGRERLLALQKRIEDLVPQYPNLAAFFAPDIKAALDAITAEMG